MKRNKWILMSLVVLGSAVGGALRALSGASLNKVTHFPWSIFGVNLLGSIAIGALFVFCSRSAYEQFLRALLMIGLMGGLTTFSGFSFDVLGMLVAGKLELAVIYVFSSVLLGLLGAFLGMTLMRLKKVGELK
jgi:fluoride exporter